jgi:hypothetical protein
VDSEEVKMTLCKWLVAASFTAGLLACSREIKLDPRMVMHPNGAIWKSWSIEHTPKGDTLIQGPWKEFFWNGSPSISTIYVDGKKQGSSQAWYDNNSPKWSKVYAADKPTGTWILFTKEGRTWIEVSFNDKGQIEGKVKVIDRTDKSVVHLATYKAGECVDGDCNALKNPAVQDDLPADTKAILLKDGETIQAFLE